MSAAPEPAEASTPAKPSPVAWLKANFLAVALGVQMVVLVVALAALAISGAKTSALPAHQPTAEALEPLAQPPAEGEGEAPAPAEEPPAEAPGEKPAEHAAAEPPAKPAHEPPAHEPPAKEGKDGKDNKDAKAKARAEAARAATQETAAAEPTASPGAAEESSPVARALAELMDGNERFAQGVTRMRDPIALRRSPGKPRAVVLACADAAVPPELVFDQSLGSLVVVRTPAELVDEGALAAVEDAVSRLGVPLVVVLGHQGCHAVDVAAHGLKAGPGLATIAARIKPAITAARKPGLSAVEANTRAVDATVSFAASQLLKRSKLLRGGQTPIMRGVYDEASGQVRWLDAGDEAASAPAEHPAHAAR